ncbi:MAG: hypothetical protein WC162_11255 [Sphaerochaetaceae bacterium]
MQKEYCIMPTSTMYETERRDGLHRHEVFFGYNRQKSIKYGLVVFLPPELHNMSDMGVHFNHDFDIALKKIGQQAFTEHYPDMDFQETFGKNYL